MTAIKSNKPVRDQKAAQGMKVQTNVRAGVGFNDRDSATAPYGVF